MPATTDPQSDQSPGLTLSSRVRVNLPDGGTATGTIVEDFADMIPVGDSRVRIDEHRSAQLRRWGIAVDDDTLVFADDPDVAALPESEDPRPTQSG